MVSLRALLGIGGIGGMVTGLTGLTLHNILQNRMRDSPVYQEAMKYINKHPDMDHLLGKPITSSRADLSNDKNVMSLRITTLEFPVSGPKTHGMLSIWADRLKEEDQWNVYRIELEILDKYGGRISLRNRKPLLNMEEENSNIVLKK